MTKTLQFLTLSVMAALLGSCGNSEYPGYERNENGLQYKFFTQNEGGVKPKLGDYVVLSLLNKFNDSVIYVSRQANPDKGVAQYYIEDVKFKGSLEEGLMMMSVGD